MRARGKKILLVTGTLEIILGLLSILGIVILLMTKNNVPTLTQEEATRALGGLLILYGVYGVNILGGLLGVIFADRPKYSSLLMVCGFILILMQISTWSYVSLELMDIIINVIIILIPCYYFYGACLNYKDYNTEPRKRTVPSKATEKTASVKKTTVATPKKKTTTKTSEVKKTPAKKTTTKKATRKSTPKKTTATKKTTKKK